MNGGSWVGKVALAVCTTVITLGVLGAAGEVVVRYRERHRSTVPGSLSLLFYQHNRLRHALVRNYDYFGWVHIDGEGFRGAEVTTEKPSDVLRIMVVGSSTTFDPQVTKDDAAWPARLQVWLTRLSPGRKFEVINGGVPGYRVADDLIRLELELYQYQPDLIVLYEGHNDLFGALQRSGGEEGDDAEGTSPSRPGEMPTMTPWEHWLTTHSLLYTKLKKRLIVINFSSRGKAVLRSRGTESLDPVINRGVENITRDMTSFLAVARGFGFRVAVPELVNVSGAGATVEADPITRDEWRHAVPFAPPEAVLAGYARYDAAVRSVAERNGAQWIATGSCGLTGRRWYAAEDPIHFNNVGADRFGECMARALVSAGLIGK
jgi:lysophospholipase L1-like esterase